MLLEKQLFHSTLSCFSIHLCWQQNYYLVNIVRPIFSQGRSETALQLVLNYHWTIVTTFRVFPTAPSGTNLVPVTQLSYARICTMLSKVLILGSAKSEKLFFGFSYLKLDSIAPPFPNLLSLLFLHRRIAHLWTTHLPHFSRASPPFLHSLSQIFLSDSSKLLFALNLSQISF